MIIIYSFFARVVEAFLIYKKIQYKKIERLILINENMIFSIINFNQ